MIDKNGKLFGKINIIDLIVVIVVIAAVAVFGFAKISQKNNAAASVSNEITLEFATDEVNDYVLEHVKEGEPIYDFDKDVELGTVTSFEVTPSKVFNVNSEGKVVASEKEGFSGVTITGKVQGQLTPLGAVVGGETYGVGHTLTIRVGKAKIHLKVSDIK